MLVSKDFFERSLFSFLLGFIILIISLIFYYPYLKNKKKKPIYGIKRNNSVDYLRDGIKIIMYSRIKGFLYLVFLLILLSIVFLLIGLFKL